MNKLPLRTDEETDFAFQAIREKVYYIKARLVPGDNGGFDYPTNDEIMKLLSEIAGLTLLSDVNNAELIRYLVEIPFTMFVPLIMITASGVWFAVMKDKPQLSVLLLSEIAKNGKNLYNYAKGLFTRI